MVRPLYRLMHGVLLSVASVAAATPALPGSTLATDAVRGALAVPVKAAAPVKVAVPVKAAAPVKAAVPVKTVAPVKAVTAVKAVAAVKIVTPVKVAPVKTVVPVKTVPPAAPTVVRTPVRVSTPARTANAAQVAQQAQQRAAEQNRAAAIAREAATSATLAQSVVRGRSAIVRATAYNSAPNQTDSTPFITATGTRTRPGVVALSRDLLRTFPYGSKVMIEDLSGRFNGLLKGRVFMVEDTMAARKTNSLDIWMSSHSQAINFGARQVRITAVR